MIQFLTALFGVVLAAVQPAAAAAPRNFIVHEAPQALPEIRFEDAAAQSHSLAEFRGKLVLVNIWATWCVPCRKEMPTLDRLQVQLGGPQFKVMTLSIDRRGAGAVKTFYAEIGIRNLDLFVDASAQASQALGVFGLPTTLLIDRDGRELGRLIGPAEWDAPDMIAFIKQMIAQQAGALPAPQRKEKDS